MTKLLRYLPFHFLCFLLIGILVQFYYKLWDFGFQNLVLLFFLLLIFLYLLQKTKVFETLVFSTFFSVGIAIVYVNDTRNNENYFEQYLTKKSFKTLIVTRILKPGNYYDKYEAKVSKIDSFSTTGYVLINIKKDSLQKPIQVGQYLHTKSEFSELISPLNPYQFDYKSYLAKQGIHRQVFLEKDQYLLTNQFKFSLKRVAFLLRAKIQNALLKYNFSDDEFAVINALLLGQRQEISKELIDSYAKAGAIHILAVSGLHVGIILLLLNFLFTPIDRLKNGKIIKVIVVIILLWFFALLAGLSASVVRAVTMFSFVAIGLVLHRKNSVEHSLVISMFLLLILKPMFLFDVGFQLSYLAAFGIVWVQPKLYKLYKPKLKLVDYYWQLITVSLAAQFGILPISIYYFHQFPGLFLLSNLVIIPFLGIILALGVLVIILSLINCLPKFLAHLYETIISYMNSFIYWIAQQESLLFSQISYSLAMVFASYLLIIIGYQFAVKKNAKWLILFLISILFVQSIFWIEKFEINSKSEFVIFHKSRASIFAERFGAKAIIYHDLDSVIISDEKLINSYKVGENVELQFSKTLSNYFELNKRGILIVNNKNFYTKVQGNPIVILKNSPKINLERLINQIKPSYIIADGSNFKSYVNKWETTCFKTKTFFWYTGKNGAFIAR